MWITFPFHFKTNWCVASYFNNADHSISHFFSAYPLVCALNAVLISSECRVVEMHTMEGRFVSLCVAEKDSSHIECMWVGESVSYCFLLDYWCWQKEVRSSRKPKESRAKILTVHSHSEQNCVWEKNRPIIHFRQSSNCYFNTIITWREYVQSLTFSSFIF